jgi:DNA-binding response OmpR family regulator
MKNSGNDPSVSALLIGEYGEDRLLLHDIGRSSGWRLFEARDRRRAQLCLETNPIQVVIAECDIPNWNWKALLYDLQRRFPAPQLVVTSRTADDYLWAEVLNMGGFDVLARPLERDEVERVIASARRYFDIRTSRATSQPLQRAVGAA